MFISILFIMIGFLLLIKGADFLVDGASDIAKKFHIPEILIGLTIVSIGTSMPELFVSVTSALEGYNDMAIGNVIGSNVCNLLLILGLSSIIRPIAFQKETKWIEIPLCLFFTILFMMICNVGHSVTRVDSMILIVGFLSFIGYTIWMGLRSQNKHHKLDEKISLIKSICFLLLGIVALKFGGDLTIKHAVILANKFHISEKIISLTVLAIGTSLPELITSVTAAHKGNSDIAIGNIIGSNIFNLLLIIGVSSFIHPIVYNISYNLELMILVVATILLALFPIIPPKNTMNRWNGFIYVLLYVAYLGILFCA